MGVWTYTKDNQKTIYIRLIEIIVQTSELRRLFDYNNVYKYKYDYLSIQVYKCIFKEVPV